MLNVLHVRKTNSHVIGTRSARRLGSIWPLSTNGASPGPKRRHTHSMSTFRRLRAKDQKVIFQRTIQLIFSMKTHETIWIHISRKPFSFQQRRVITIPENEIDENANSWKRQTCKTTADSWNDEKRQTLKESGHRTSRDKVWRKGRTGSRRSRRPGFFLKGSLGDLPTKLFRRSVLNRPQFG